jgi:hypothetical protein
MLRHRLAFICVEAAAESDDTRLVHGIHASGLLLGR